MACLKLSNGDFGIEAFTPGNRNAAPISMTRGPRAVRAGVSAVGIPYSGDRMREPTP